MIALLLAVAIAALIASLLDPGFGLNLASLATYIGFLLALGVVLISFELPAIVVHRRRTREVGRLRVLPWALAMAAIFVLISRLAALQPGYLYGVVLGVVFMGHDTPVEEGREQAAGAIWTLLVAVGAWAILGWLRILQPDTSGFGMIVAQTALAAITVAGLEAVAFGLMPLRFMPGRVVYEWSRTGWAILFGLSVFAFVYLLIGPNSGYLSELSSAGLVAAAGVFVAFGLFSILFWGYFRFRPARVSVAAGEE